MELYTLREWVRTSETTNSTEIIDVIKSGLNIKNQDISFSFFGSIRGLGLVKHEDDRGHRDLDYRAVGVEGRMRIQNKVGSELKLSEKPFHSKNQFSLLK